MNYPNFPNLNFNIFATEQSNGDCNSRHPPSPKYNNGNSKVQNLYFGLHFGGICSLRCLDENPKATQKEIACMIEKSERTIKTITSSLVQKGILIRRNGRRNGWWEISN